MAIVEKGVTNVQIKHGIIVLILFVISYFFIKAINYGGCISFCDKFESALPGIWSGPNGCKSNCQFFRLKEFIVYLICVFVPSTIVAVILISRYELSAARKLAESRSQIQP